ncbi:MAG: signal recognition particle-docking protein FtsY [Pseudomonadota bacterium]
MSSDAGDSQPGSEERGGLWKRFKRGLSKTREQLGSGVGNLLLGEKEISDDVLDELETALLVTDVGIDATAAIMERLTARVKRRELNDTVALHGALGEVLLDMLAPMTGEFSVTVESKPCVVFFVGVNGVGKTTTIGKLAHRLKSEGRAVMLAAGDTFRAAAVEQLQTWGERNDVPVVAQAQGSDSASVVFDAVQAGRSRGVDVVLADTAGRLQAKSNLMDELAKIRRVVARIDDQAPHEVILVLDGGVGQNALSQLREFHDTVGVTGLVLTKLDGTAKAGVLFALAHALGERRLPVYFVGVGEAVEDLRPFEPEPFVSALLDRD